jgi:SAM-dependent methyltransferase
VRERSRSSQDTASRIAGSSGGTPYNAAMVRKAAERLIVKTRDLIYDLRHRVRTRGVVPIAELGLTLDSIQYEGIAPKTLRKAIAALGPVNGYTFVDLGSGMGRAVLVASEFPFRRIVGVEIVPELHAIASRNVRQYRGRQQCRDIHLLQLDALRYRQPNCTRGALVRVHCSPRLSLAKRSTKLLAYSTADRPLISRMTLIVRPVSNRPTLSMSSFVMK